MKGIQWDAGNFVFMNLDAVYVCALFEKSAVYLCVYFLYILLQHRFSYCLRKHTIKQQKEERILS